MKKLLIKNIDLKDKTIKALSIWLDLKIPKDIENWTVDDALLTLSLKIQRDLIFKRCDACPNDLMTWRQNISKAITETTDKFNDPQRLLPYGYDVNDQMLSYIEDWTEYETYAERWGGSTKDIGVVALGDEGFAKTPKGLEEYEKELMFRRAKFQAKKELEAEQKEEKERLEIERKAKKEVIIPFKKYRADAE